MLLWRYIYKNEHRLMMMTNIIINYGSSNWTTLITWNRFARIVFVIVITWVINPEKYIFTMLYKRFTFLYRFVSHIYIGLWALSNEVRSTNRPSSSSPLHGVKVFMSHWTKLNKAATTSTKSFIFVVVFFSLFFF